MALTAEQIAAAGFAAGWRGEDLAMATAIALAESGGRADATNLLGRDRSYGLWQVNLHPVAHAGRWQPAQLLDPVGNARAAHTIWAEAGGWRPWSVYGSGAYRQHLGRARSAAAAAEAAGGTVPVPVPVTVTPGGTVDLVGLPNPFDVVGDVASAITSAPAKLAAAVGNVLSDLIGEAFISGLGLVFTLAALALIAVGVTLLTGAGARKSFEALTKGAGVATTAAGAAS